MTIIMILTVISIIAFVYFLASDPPAAAACLAFSLFMSFLLLWSNRPAEGNYFFDTQLLETALSLYILAASIVTALICIKISFDLSAAKSEVQQLKRQIPDYDNELEGEMSR